MKYPTLFFFIGLLCVSCGSKIKKVAISEAITTSTYPDFIIDTTLQRAYLEYSMASSMPDDWSGEVSSAEIAFRVAEPILKSGFGEEEIENQKPFSINLINNEIWVIDGTLHQHENEIVMGGTAYMEIRKSNGEIIKILHGK